ncbi:zinc-ribbon domain-containing protein [Candidatus Pacearchaeota archaeon]|nr:zinc-ribbon domain-containing protein [Candidatus Pacearchaeota archaeon]
MFRKKCPRCGRKIEREYDFCPYCGIDFRWQKKQERERDFGMLGKEDSFGMPDFSAMNLTGLFNSKLFSSLFNEFDKQLHELDKEMIRKPKENIRKTGISISINMSNGKNPDIKISGIGDFKNMQKEISEKKIPKLIISDEQAKKFSKLPKKEAKTDVRRLSNKIIYEIDLPGIKSLKDIIINKLENSIEIKAFSDENAYFKLIPLNLPILNYKLDNEKLVLELGTK